MYPIIYSAAYEEEGRNRLTAFFRLILAIPWQIVAFFYGIAAFIGVVIAWFAILFTGRYPEGLYDFVAGFVRFNARLNSWYYLLTDEWPAFNGEPDEGYPIRVAIHPPLREYSRLKVLFRLIIGIPVYLLLYVMGIIAGVVAFLAWFALVFAARLPDGFYKPIRAAMAYQAKANGYFFLLTEDYPPFWTEEEEERPQLEAPAASASPSLADAPASEPSAPASD
jgi:hypothetical protein